LVELLVVISIIAILATLMFPTIRGVDRAKRLSRAKAELAQMESFIESYKAKLGYYPPDNRNPATGKLLPGMNQLYYELDGTILTNNNTFIDQDLTAPPMDNIKVASFFGPGVVGFMNCSRGDSDQAGVALKVLRGLRSDQVANVTASNPATHLTVTARMLVCTVAGPDPNSPPLNDGAPPLNPWRYNSSSPTNNPGFYDLWADIFVSGKTYRICNWSSKPLLVY
jgi:type II secretory pathway pseudopilin PulG